MRKCCALAIMSFFASSSLWTFRQHLQPCAWPCFPSSFSFSSSYLRPSYNLHRHPHRYLPQSCCRQPLPFHVKVAVGGTVVIVITGHCTGHCSLVLGRPVRVDLLICLALILVKVAYVELADAWRKPHRLSYLFRDSRKLVHLARPPHVLSITSRSKVVLLRCPSYRLNSMDSMSL